MSPYTVTTRLVIYAGNLRQPMRVLLPANWNVVLKNNTDET